MAIRYRKDRGCYVVDMKIDGKRFKIQKKTKKEALLCEQDLVRNHQNISDKPIFDAAKLYLKKVSKAKISGANEKRYLSLLVQYFDGLKIDKVREVKPRNLKGLQLWLLGKGLSESSVNRYFSTYKHFFRWCMSEEFHHMIPTQSVEQLSFSKKPKEIFTDEEVLTLVSESPDWLRASVEFMSLTGMRPSSFCKLTWNDVDYKNREIRYRTLKGRKVSTVKAFPMDEALESLLRGLPGLRSALAPVFLNRSGGPLSVGHFVKSTVRLRQKLGIETPTYRLRDKLITDLIEAGVPVSRAGKLAGHESEKTTMGYVGKLSNDVMVTDLLSVRAMRENRGQRSNDGAEVAHKGVGTT